MAAGEPGENCRTQVILTELIDSLTADTESTCAYLLLICSLISGVRGQLTTVSPPRPSVKTPCHACSVGLKNRLIYAFSKNHEVLHQW